jgi:myosin-crossreactive antigen
MPRGDRPDFLPLQKSILSFLPAFARLEKDLFFIFKPDV